MQATPDTHVASGVRLIGRDAELTRARTWLDGIAAGSGLGALLLEGEAGIGKTALWRQIQDEARAHGADVRVTGAAEPEAQPALAALADLLEPLPDGVLGHLPAPQHRALEALLAADTRVDLRPLGAAVRTVFERMARDRPLVLALDDAQWLDVASARVLEFALRRLTDARVALLATIRTDDDLAAEPPLHLRAWLDVERSVVLRLAAPSLGALGRILAERFGDDISRPALTRIHRVSGGNPFLALEIASELRRTGARITAEGVLPTPPDARRLAGDRLGRLAAPSRAVVELLALMARPDHRTLTRAAAATVGLDEPQLEDALADAAAEDLLTLDPDGPRFRHPILASAVAAATDPRRTRALHRALAAISSDEVEAAMHLALGTRLPDVAVASTLVATASVALDRGDQERAASLAAHARRLVPDDAPDLRHRATLVQAQALWEVDEAAASSALVEDAVRSLPAGRMRAEARLLRAVQRTWEGEHAAAIVECETAISEAVGDPATQAVARLRLAYGADADLSLGRRHADAARAILRAAPPGLTHPDLLACALLLSAELRLAVGEGIDTDAVAEADGLLTGPPAPRAPAFPPRAVALERRWLWAAAVDDVDDARRRLGDRAREALAMGLDRAAPVLLADLADLACLAGDVDAAEGHAEAAAELAALGVSTAFGRSQARLAGAIVAAHRGSLEDARRLGEAILHDGTGNPDELRLRVALARGELAAGRPSEAHGYLEPLPARLAAVGLRDPAAYRMAGELIEALALTGRLAEAHERLAVLRPDGDDHRPWRRAVAQRCVALLAAVEGDPAAVEHAHAAVDLHERLGMPVELGRALLLAGRLERARKQKRSASELFARAATVFGGAGAVGWLRRAEAERARVGLRPRAPMELTPTEAEVATLTARGMTNREVAEALVMSPRSIDAVLTRVYTKLGIRSRAELGARIGGTPAH